MRRREFLAAGMLAPCVFSTRAFADSYPSRPIRVYQGFAAGGNADVIARVVSAEMMKALREPLIVEAQPGAGGTIAATTVARSRPDGYTLLLATAGHIASEILYSKLNYRTELDFQMVSTVTYFPFLLVVRADSPYSDFGSVLAAARSDPNAISFGTAGVGSMHQLAGELLTSKTGTRMLHIPYKGDAASVTALMGGDVPLIIAPPTAVLQSIKAGKLRAIATTGARRWKILPSIPTVAEQGVAGYEVMSWAGFMAAAGTPRPIVDRLHASIAHALEVPGVRARLEEMGGEVTPSAPEEMAAMISAELKKWTAVAQAAHIQKQ